MGKSALRTIMAGLHMLRKGCHHSISSSMKTASSIAIRQLSSGHSAAPSVRLDGKVAIVTGSTDGIGFAISRRLAQEGAHVVISSRKQNNVDKAVSVLQQEGLSKVIGQVCSVGKRADLETLVHNTLSKWGKIDILVANAGMNPYFGRTLDMPEETWNKIFDVNLKSAFILTQMVVPHMEKAGGGSVIYMSSFAGLQPFPEIGAYSVAKTALLGLTKVLAAECGPQKIRVNCIAPGLIQTHLAKAIWSEDSMRHDYESKTVLKRIGQPEEIAGLAAFLCSDDASFIAGEVICATGGYTSRL